MDKNQPNEVKKYHTWELFQARARDIKPNTPAKSQRHLYAAPPATVLHKTECGIEIPVPVQPNWREY